MRTLTVLVVLSLVGSGCAVDAPSSALGTAPPPSLVGPSATASAPTSPTPQSSIGRTIRWERIATVADAPDRLGDWRTLGGFAGGYAAIQSSPAAVWFSADGINWIETRLSVPHGTAVQVEAIAGGGDEIMIGGSYTPCSRRAYERDPFSECRPRPGSWVSSDGRSWRASPPWKGPVGETGRSGSLFQQLWAVPGQGELDPQVAIHDPAGRSVDDDLGDPAHLSQGTTQRSLLLDRMRPPVARVRDELRGRYIGVAGDPRARRSCSLPDSVSRSCDIPSQRVVFRQRAGPQGPLGVPHRLHKAVRPRAPSIASTWRSRATMAPVAELQDAKVARELTVAPGP